MSSGVERDSDSEDSDSGSVEPDEPPSRYSGGGEGKGGNRAVQIHQSITF